MASRFLKAFLACAVAALLGLVAPSARAQVPGVAVPALPPQVVQLIEQSETTLIPVLVQAGATAYPVVNAVGFPLRPACAYSWVTVLVLAEAGSALPSTATTPLLQPTYMVCGAILSPGPADPVFAQVDGAAGKQVASAVQPVLNQVQGALAPARPRLAQVCSAMGLVGKPNRYLEPPLSRFDVTRVACGH